MAATHYNPLPLAPGIEDPVNLQEASALFARTGHKASVETLRRYIHEDEIDTVRVGPKRTVYASYSDLLDAHFKRTAAKLRATADWP